MFKSVLLSLILCVTLSLCQESGTFWWKNRDVVNTASQSRSLKEQSAKIRTLPPRYRHEDQPTTTSTTTTKKPNSIRDLDSLDEDHSQYKYDNEPDCVCVKTELCNENKTLITDGNGLIDER